MKSSPLLLLGFVILLVTPQVLADPSTKQVTKTKILCRDSDGGENAAKAGKVELIDSKRAVRATYKDACHSQEALIETVCRGGLHAEVAIRCYCKQGACQLASGKLKPVKAMKPVKLKRPSTHIQVPVNAPPKVKARRSSSSL